MDYVKAMNNELTVNGDTLEILGIQLNKRNKSHVHNRSKKCKRQFYSLHDVGMGFQDVLQTRY